MPLDPAPQLAVNRGLGLMYNVERVAGVLGGSVHSYLLHGDKRLSLADIDPSLVGRKVCTKAVGGGVASLPPSLLASSLAQHPPSPSPVTQ